VIGIGIVGAAVTRTLVLAKHAAHPFFKSRGPGAAWRPAGSVCTSRCFSYPFLT
jgi:hypothetical protein